MDQDKVNNNDDKACCGCGPEPVDTGDNDGHHETIRQSVRSAYGEIADSDTGCGCGTSGCCSGTASVQETAKRLGYSEQEVSEVPDGANMGLGCGNPLAIGALVPGETVVDLGCGGGFDCFLASKRVGDSGHVIGIDMTPEMVYKARENVSKGGYKNVEIRLGEIEHLPVSDSSVDVILSNCVINLSPDKMNVFHEAYRILKPGGRLSIMDIIAMVPLPEEIRNDLAFHSGCVAGAASAGDIEKMLEEAGFESIAITPKEESRELIRDWVGAKNIEKYVISASIEAIKPR